MNTAINTALEHCRDAAAGFVTAVDMYIEQHREPTAAELATLEQHFTALRTAREQYEQALVDAGLDRPSV